MYLLIGYIFFKFPLFFYGEVFVISTRVTSYIP